jgi:endogenous inhibitor of DNA gyrase (YacG/DUF329 family)
MVQRPNSSYQCKSLDLDAKAQKRALIEVERKEKSHLQQAVQEALTVKYILSEKEFASR